MVKRLLGVLSSPSIGWHKALYIYSLLSLFSLSTRAAPPSENKTEEGRPVEGAAPL
jgi:hypothetical protein